MLDGQEATLGMLLEKLTQGGSGYQNDFAVASSVSAALMVGAANRGGNGYNLSHGSGSDFDTALAGADGQVQFTVLHEVGTTARFALLEEDSGAGQKDDLV